MAKDVLITPANGIVEFSNNSVNQASIYELNGDLYITSNSGAVVFGDGTPSNVVLGNSTIQVDLTFAGGGALTSNGNALDVGQTGDTVNLNVSGVTYNLPNTVYQIGDTLANLNVSSNVVANIFYATAGASNGTILAIDTGQVLRRISTNGGLHLGRDDSLYLTGGDVAGGYLQGYFTNAADELVAIGAEQGVFLFGAANNLTGETLTVDKIARWQVTSTGGRLGLGTASPGYTLDVRGDAYVNTDLTVAGNLTVSGTTTYINTTTLNIGDNIITLNADVSGATAPSENAGFEVNRGSSANVALRWNETTDKWETTTDGTTYLTVATNNDVSTAYSNAIAYSGNAAAAYSNATTFAANATNLSSGTVAFARLPSLYIGTTSIQSTSGAQAVSGISTLAAGNTTITGSLSFTTTLSANGGTGTAGHVLTSAGTGSAYWAAPAGALPTTIAVQNTTGTATASGANAIAIGAGASASNTNTIAIGASASAPIASSIAIGGSTVTDSTGDVAVGYGATARYGGTAVGYQAKSGPAPGNSNTVSIGQYSQANIQSTVVGAYANAQGSLNVNIGYNTKTDYSYNVVIGANANASLVSYGTVVGASARVTAASAIAVGYLANSSGDSAISLGRAATATAANSIAIGTSVTNGNTNSIRLGTNIYTVQIDGGLRANGSVGTAGQVLTSNGSVIYWADGGGGALDPIVAAIALG